jgi:MoaA/NifB/PqqE/SkfB family radical SAM enzyme
MSFQDVIRRSWREHRLVTVLAELTYRCNLDCFFCYNDLSRSGRPMATEDWHRFFEDLAEMNVFALILSGGEPLSHPDFLAIGRRARELGFVIRLKSNGHTLRGDLARRVREEVDPFKVEVSLHGARAGTHDRQTRIEGSFERLISNLRELRELGYRVQINSTLTRWNEHEIEAMYALADEIGYPLRVDPQITPRDDGDLEPLEIRPSRAGVERFLALASQRMTAGVEDETDDPARPAAVESDKHCGAGSGAIAVDPFGNVYPCVQWRRPVGSLHEYSIQEIWNGSVRLAEVRRDNQRVREVVSGREAGGGAGFCPGAAELQTGSVVGLYDRALVPDEKAQSDDSGREGRVLSLPVLNR